jgi:hypothetical protein
MKKSFKITLWISLLLNIVFIALKFFNDYRIEHESAIFKKRNIQDWQKTVNTSIAKKNFMDSLFIQHPQLKTKKYLLLHFWTTRHFWCTKPLPIYDTLIQPLNPEVGYVLINGEKEAYSKKVLKEDSGTTKNFLFAFNAENFILAINQELKFKPCRYWYPKYPLSVIMRTDSSNIIFYDTLGIVGKSAPEDSLRDKQSYKALKKALNELK